MPLRNFPKEEKKFEIQTYERPEDEQQLRNTHVAFSGSPQKHPFNPDKVILVSDPYSTNTFYYEFNTSDITYVEELANIVNIEGVVIPMARIWVKRKSIAVRSTPFIVEHTVTRNN
ncbi:MAG: inorganic pyrophosphatase Ppa [Desulfobulbaceae bacterium]|nr:inorganic pyrophosphatase Ppa [Desulfobulbaceae bacterium]HIJ78475.1 inorganic pyrophosphatase Ppa [Deltaproteobacteria bacterium]